MRPVFLPQRHKQRHDFARIGLAFAQNPKEQFQLGATADEYGLDVDAGVNADLSESLAHEIESTSRKAAIGTREGEYDEQKLERDGL